MKEKIKLAILLNGSSLGGTERSALVTYKYLDRNRFDPVLLMFEKPNESFVKRLGDITPVVVERKNLYKYVKLKKIEVIYSFAKIEREQIKKLKNISKILQSIVFTESYDEIYDSNLIISKTEYLKCKIYNDNRIENSRVLYFPIDVKKWEDLSAKVKPYCSDRRIVMGRIGRAEPSKWDYLILSTLHYYKRKDNFRKYMFVFAGMPKLYKAYIKIFFRKAVKNGSIILLPELVTDEEVARFYKSLNLFLQACWIGESFGCVMTEAFCFDVPVVTDWKHFINKKGKADLMKYDTQLEVVDKGKSGFYSNYPRMTYEQLKNQTKESLRKLGKNGHEKTKSLYEAEKVVKNFENIILGEIIGKDEKRKSEIYPSQEEIDGFINVYNKNFEDIEKLKKKIPKAHVISYTIKAKIWRLTEYIYLGIRKMLKRLFGYDIEKR